MQIALVADARAVERNRECIALSLALWASREAADTPAQHDPAAGDGPAESPGRRSFLPSCAGFI